MWKNKPEVKIIADSVNIIGERITTFELKYWRPILPEMNTHRVFSRNAASSRAQSFTQRCKDIWTDPHVPAHWNAEQPGMVGGEEFSPEVQDYINERIKELARNNVHFLRELNKQVKERTGLEIHKQYLNRYLEPFTTVTQLVTSTEWNNFFKLRLAEDAQPEIKDMAMEMFTLLNQNNPVRTEKHLPYIQYEEMQGLTFDELIKISVARCARVSYKPYSGESDFQRDLRLYHRLLNNGHMSPFEHIAFSAPNQQYYNLMGWRSLRYEIEHPKNYTYSGSASSV